MSITLKNRVDRLNWIRQRIARIIEKEKQDSFNQEGFLADIICKFYVSRRVALEDVEAAKRFLNF